MSSVISEDVILTVASGETLGSKAHTINITEINCTNITISGTFNGNAVSGAIVFASASQQLSNKSLEDTTTTFVDVADNTKTVRIDAGGATSTGSVVQFNQVANRIYTVPDSGANCAFVMTSGDQIVAGAKSFVDISTNTFAVGAEATATGLYSAAVGYRASATHDKSQVYNSGTTVLASTAADQWSAKFSNGFRYYGDNINYNDNVFYYNNSRVTTTDATITTLYTLPTISNHMYVLNVSVMGISETGDTTHVRLTNKVKNINGTVTKSADYDRWDSDDAGMSSSNVDVVISGTSILVRVTGIAATTIKWTGEVRRLSLSM